MRKLLGVLLLLGLTSCASRSFELVPETSSNPVDTRQILRLVGIDTVAHACPVGGVVYSARHVLFKDYKFRSFSWSDRKGNSGELNGIVVLDSRDLGEAGIRTGEPEYLTQAGEMPSIGDTLYWTEYDFRQGLRSKFRSAEVKNVVSEHIILDDAPEQGASGSCVLNEQGEVVGIMSWRIIIGLERTGVAVALPQENK